MKTRTGLVLTCIFLLVSGNKSMCQFSILGELRPRTEYRHGYKTLITEPENPAFFTSQRTRVKLSYGGQKMRIGISFQDIRTWGNTSQLNASDDWLSLHEAWAEILISEIISLKLGRQEVVLDDHRIMGNVGWAQQSRSHDIAILKVMPADQFNLQIGLAYNQDMEQVSGNFYSVPNNYKTMQYVWFNKKWAPISTSFLVLNNGIQTIDSLGDSKTLFSQTIGGYILSTPEPFTIAGSAYLQLGKDASENKLRAYQLMGTIRYTIGPGLPKPFIGVEILSGTNERDILNPDFNKNHSFTPLYGTNHKFNGHMDYFYVGNHINNIGLMDFHAGGEWQRDKLGIGLTMHQFLCHAFLRDPANTNDDLNRNLGTEIDVRTDYTIAENLTISLGYSHMWATGNMEALKGGDRGTAQNWLWCMVSFTPVFFNSED